MVCVGVGDGMTKGTTDSPFSSCIRVWALHMTTDIQLYMGGWESLHWLAHILQFRYRIVHIILVISI